MKVTLASVACPWHSSRQRPNTAWHLRLPSQPQPEGGTRELAPLFRTRVTLIETPPGTKLACTQVPGMEAQEKRSGLDPASVQDGEGSEAGRWEPPRNWLAAHPMVRLRACNGASGCCLRAAALDLNRGVSCKK